MAVRDGPPESGVETINKSRIEALSDGVIAVAITLLALDLKVPSVESTGDLARALGAQWPAYLAYVISFLAIGIMWISHHAMLRRLAGVDHSIMVLNVVLLMCIAVLPFSTSLFSEYLTAPTGGHLAAAVYAGSFLVTSLTFLLLQWVVVARRPHLLREPLDRAQQRAILLRGAISAPIYLLAALLGLVTPYFTLAICILLGLFYFLPRRPLPTPSSPK